MQRRRQQRMEGDAAAKRRRLDRRQRGLSSDGSSFHMEDLPEEIQTLVLSLLSLKEAARTSLVSRNWRKLWTRYPNLCFDGSKDGSTDDMDSSVKIEREKFFETVDSIIQHHCGIGLNKFSVRFSIKSGMDSSDILNRWICFATASKAKIIDMNLCPKGNYVDQRSKQFHHFPLEALGAHQDGPFIQCLFLTNVSIKPYSDICGFTKLRSLHLHYIQIIGDLSGLLSNCSSSLEDLEVISCPGLTDLNIPHQLDKLRHLLISNMRIQMLEFHVPNLSHFGYKGNVIPIVLHGCSKLEKATLTYHRTWFEKDNDKVLGHVFHGIPSVSAVKVLHVHANTYAGQPVWSPQVHSSTRPASMFLNLRHLFYEIVISTRHPNRHSGILQLAQNLSFVPQLETLELHMFYDVRVGHCWRDDGVSCHMRRHDRLKTVYMSGFRGYRAQVELLCGILEMGAVLEDVTIEPIVTIPWGFASMDLLVGKARDEICEWAHRTSQRFGKAITVAKLPQPRHKCW